LALIVLCVAVAAQSEPQDPLPQNIEEFQATARRVLEETGVPGAGIALVRSDGVEWEGGVGYADRDAKTAVNADTHFRIGSISKTFVALALVQLYEDGEIDFDTAVREIAPEIAIDNPWEDTHPVRVIHVLQHTAGFDDFHFNEMRPPPGAPELPLEDLLKLNPNSRRVRWRPGTRMAYSNPGYGVAGYLIEKVSGQPYDEYIRQEIFTPLEMPTSSFRLTSEDEPLLARGYADASGPSVGLTREYFHPAGNMHSSPHEMAKFVQMLLGWGELGTAFVVDPEYLGNMELPQTTLASKAGVRNGYGSGVFTRVDLPFKVLGHNGGILGFISSYGYSPARDVGYVVLLNSTGPRAVETVDRLSSLAIRYLKRDVEPPKKPEVAVDAAILDRYAGFYRQANPRSQFFWAFQSLSAGWSVFRDGDRLYIKPLFGRRVPLVPVTESSFRLESEIDASRVFTLDDDGGMVMAGGTIYAERIPRWRVEIVRVSIAASLALVASVIVVALVWLIRIRRSRPRGFWWLKTALLLCPLALLVPFLTARVTQTTNWGVANAITRTIFVGTLAIPALALVVSLLTLVAMRQRVGRWLAIYAASVSLAMALVSLYLSSHDMLGLRLWRY
jgi:CubicO group peptidase (beta-lactamase class C family)